MVGGAKLEALQRKVGRVEHEMASVVASVRASANKVPPVFIVTPAIISLVKQLVLVQIK